MVFAFFFGVSCISELAGLVDAVPDLSTITAFQNFLFPISQYIDTLSPRSYCSIGIVWHFMGFHIGHLFPIIFPGYPSPFSCISLSNSH